MNLTAIEQRVLNELTTQGVDMKTIVTLEVNVQFDAIATCMNQIKLLKLKT